MKPGIRKSIRAKFMSILVASNLVLLGVLGISVVHYNARAFKERLAFEMTSLSRVIAENSSAAIIFGDQDVAQQTLDALNGQEAVNRFMDTAVDLVLMDCQMPVMDGFTATKRIRTCGRAAASLPIIALTAYALAEDRQRCLDAGMDDYLSKPLDTKTLKRTLIKWLTAESISVV